MPRIMIIRPVQGYKKGDCVELSAAQIAALGSAVRTTVYRDQLGEATAVSNSSP
jgi:hypothetical protein